MAGVPVLYVRDTAPVRSVAPRSARCKADRVLVRHSRSGADSIEFCGGCSTADAEHHDRQRVWPRPVRLLHLDGGASTLKVNQSPRAERRCRIRGIVSRGTSRASELTPPGAGEGQDRRVLGRGGRGRSCQLNGVRARRRPPLRWIRTGNSANRRVGGSGHARGDRRRIGVYPGATVCGPARRHFGPDRKTQRSP